MTDTVMLDYIALCILVFTAASLMFGAIAMVFIPHNIAVERNHPHQDAIHCAGWVSLFTGHTIWPLLWIWSMAYRDHQVPKFSRIDEDTAVNDKADSEIGEDAWDFTDITDSMSLLGHKYEVLDDRIDRIERAIMAAGEAA